MLREQLKACIQNIQESSKQLTSAETDLKKILYRFEGLEQENKALECSNVAWSNRSIALQFDVLAAQDETKAIKARHDFAVSRNAQLEMELKAIKTENDMLKAKALGGKENNSGNIGVSGTNLK